LAAMAGLAVLSAVCLFAGGQSPAISLQQALDKPIDLTIENAPIAEVFRKLSEKTGVKFVLDDQTIACLPYGDQTRLDVRLKDATLRKDLPRLLGRGALQWDIEGDLVRIKPGEPLARMCRRASFDELAVLGKICSDKVASVEGSTMIEQLRKLTGDKELELVFQATGDKAAAIAQADRIMPCTGAEWLDRLCQHGPWTWYLWGDQIIILDRKAQVARQLQQQVSLRYQNEKLVTVLLDLVNRKGHVKLEMEPGVLNYVPSEIRNNFNLVMADASISQALEVISGATGLEFITTEDGVRVVPSDKLVKGGGAADNSRRPPFFVRVNMPGPNGTNIEVYFRPDELPDEMVQKIEAEKQKLVSQWMGGKPTSAPATAPSPFPPSREENH
jgi:hypothetical protein